MAIDEIGASLGDFPSITDDSAHSGKQVGVEHLQMAVMQVPRGSMQGLTSLAKFCVRLIPVDCSIHGCFASGTFRDSAFNLQR
jgi:hypothetical protein